MTQIMNFKKIEVTGTSKEEALAKAPFNIMGDATQAYKMWAKKQINGITEASKKQFMLDYLAKKSKNVAGVGFSITVDPAVSNTRQRPYAIKNKKNESGVRVYKTVFQILDKSTSSILAEVVGTQTQAKEVVKKLYTDKGFTGNIRCTYTKKVVGGEPVAFEAEYTPSVNAHVGTYIVFGIEND